MPLFVFIAGYFSKNINTPLYGRNIICRLLAPFLAFETLYTVFDFLVMGRDVLKFSFFLPYWIMWFLFSLIIWKAVLPYVLKIRSNLLILLLLAILAGYAEDIGYYASLSRTLVFFPFFLAGFYFKKEYLFPLRNRKYRLLAAFVVAGRWIAFYCWGQDVRV
jgi:fucose 4-O-acetylase-like acetyltransferase